MQHFSFTTTSMLQINTANRNKDHNATSNAMREFLLQMILFSHWFHTPELTIRIVVLWRKLHNELRDLYFSANSSDVNKSRRIRRAVHLAEKGNAYRLLLEKSNGQTHFEKLGVGEDNIKMELKVILWKDWIDLAQDKGDMRALLSMLMNFRFPQIVRNCLIS